MKQLQNLFRKFIVKENIPLIVVILVAAFYRLYKIEDYMRFLGDEGRDVLVAYNILHGHFTLLGPTSSVGGFFLGPIYYYFMAPFLFLFNYNPVGPAIGIALIGILTVWLVYFVTLRFVNKRTALVAAFIYAISPLVVDYSRSSWNPNPLPFFSLLSLYLLFCAVQKSNLKQFALVGILLGISMQLHYLAIFLGAIMFFYVLLTTFYKSNIKTALVVSVKRYLFLFVGFLIGWLPFLAFEIRHGFPDFKSITNFILHSGNTGPSVNLLGTIYDVFFRLFGRLVFDFPPPEQLWKFNTILLDVWTILILIFAVSSTLLLFHYFMKSLKEKNVDFYKYSLLVVWLVLGVLLFGFYKKAIYDYYFTFLFPLPFILVFMLLHTIYQNKKYLPKLSKIFVVIVFVAIFLVNLWGIPFKNPANRQLNQMRSIASFVMTRTDAKPFNFALITGGNSDHAYRYFFTIWGHQPTTIQFPGVDPKRKTVTDQLFVVCESLPCEPVGNSLWEVAGFGRSDIAQKWTYSVVEIYKLIHYKGND